MGIADLKQNGMSALSHSKNETSTTYVTGNLKGVRKQLQ